MSLTLNLDLFARRRHPSIHHFPSIHHSPQVAVLTRLTFTPGLSFSHTQLSVMVWGVPAISVVWVTYYEFVIISPGNTLRIVYTVRICIWRDNFTSWCNPLLDDAALLELQWVTSGNTPGHRSMFNSNTQYAQGLNRRKILTWHFIRRWLKYSTANQHAQSDTVNKETSNS